MKCIYFIHALLYVYGFWWFIAGLLQSVEDHKMYNFTYMNIVKKQDVSTEIHMAIAAVNMGIGVMLGFENNYRDHFTSELNADNLISLQFFTMGSIMCGLFTIIINLEYMIWPVTYAISCIYAIALINLSNNLDKLRTQVTQSNQVVPTHEHRREQVNDIEMGMICVETGNSSNDNTTRKTAQL